MLQSWRHDPLSSLKFEWECCYRKVVTDASLSSCAVRLSTDRLPLFFERW